MQVKHFALYFKDLTKEAQNRFLERFDIKEEDGNFEFAPITIIDMEEKEIIKEPYCQQEKNLTLDDAL
jgi:hypothetical protein